MMTATEWTPGIRDALIAMAKMAAALYDTPSMRDLAASLRDAADRIDDTIESTYLAWTLCGHPDLDRQIRFPAVSGCGRAVANLRHALDARQSERARAECARAATYHAQRILYDLDRPLDAAGAIVEQDFRLWRGETA